MSNSLGDPSMSSPLLDRGSNTMLGPGMASQSLQMVPTGSSQMNSNPGGIGSPMNLNMNMNIGLNMNMNLNGKYFTAIFMIENIFHSF